MLAEVAPAAPLIIEALPALGILCAFLFIWGCLHVLDSFVRALFGTISGVVGWIPYAGRILAAPVHRIEQKISYALGSAERAIDGHIAVAWHKLALIARHAGREIEGLSKALWGVVVALDAYLTIKHFRSWIQALLHPIRTLQHIERALLRNVIAGERALTHELDHVVFPRLRTAEHELDHVIDVTIPGIRAGIHEAEWSLERLWKWVRARRLALTTGAFIGALVWALGRLGLGWVRCSNVKRVGRALCGLPAALIEALLALGLAFAVVIDPRKTAEAAVAVEDVMESLIRKIAD